MNPRVTDDDQGEITVTLDGNELRGWSYSNDAERRTKMLCAREYVEGWCDGQASLTALQRPAPDADRMRAALMRIEKWFGEFPETGEYWDREKTQPMSYGAQYGSNGERDYMRSIAREALAASPSPGQPKWRHKKRGTLYEVLTDTASLQCSNAPPFETMFENERWTVYRSVDTGATYIRPTNEFLDGRFEPLIADQRPLEPIKGE